MNHFRHYLNRPRYILTHRRPTKAKMAREFNTKISWLLDPIGEKETLHEFNARLELGHALGRFYLFAIGADRDLNLQNKALAEFVQWNRVDLDND